MRPKSVIQAEWAYLAATALLVLGTVLVWEPLRLVYGTGLAAGVTAFIAGAFLLLILFTTRRGSPIARGLLVALTALGTISLLYQVATGQVALGLVGVVNIVQVGLTIVGAVLLFRPAAALWFARPHDDWEEDAR
ncbi:hypothetical protein GCM10011380_16490 [Sphingomonas metalli]|uniref:Uncharacterized protein n=1 Tax=Sphingomonas metalli TaxID=1779358 RepID=A0A916WRG1_9SPHN|nr:hypothetical protein [Sphingomonas metalli]GGB27516.1 hypothetical protein GCM10011380_16490 [Sphingomonas metalli]